jgi:hypothetical protein
MKSYCQKKRTVLRLFLIAISGILWGSCIFLSEIPDAPENLRIIGNSGGVVELEWDKVEGADEYFVEYSGDGGEWKEASGYGYGNYLGRSISGLTPGLSYKFRVQAFESSYDIYGPWAQISAIVY